jgi:solute carrier family 25 S-adenosylmethionine transporter 26
VAHSAASAIAEMAACLAIAPAEVVKQNAQMLRKAQTSTSSSSKLSSFSKASTSAEAFRHLVSGPGAARKLWAGYTALVARNLPFTALQFPVFEHVRAVVKERRRTKERRIGGGGGESLWEVGAVTGASAGVAGALAAWATTPLDVVKTRMMLSAGRDASDVGEAIRMEDVSTTTQDGKGKGKGHEKGKGKGKGMVRVTRDVWRESGARGLFRGGALRSVWTAVGSGLYLGTYEVAKVYLGGDQGGGEE